MKAVKFLPLAFLLLFIASCSSVKVTTDYDKSVNFAQYKTYAFLKEGVDNLKINDIDKKRILTAIEQQLEQKGFVKSSSDPDLLINLFTNLKNKLILPLQTTFILLGAIIAQGGDPIGAQIIPQYLQK